MAQHLKHGGSVAARTIQCPAWIRLASEVPFTLDGKNNAAADEGTMLHNCMENLYGLEGEHLTPESELEDGAEYNGQKLTQDLIESKLRPAIDALEFLMDKYNISDWKVEPFVKISDDMGGSIDLIGRSADKKTVTIVDYKFGYVNVEVVENAQAQFYALAAATDPSTSDWFGPDLETIVLAIIQPNDNGEDLQTWETNLNQIDAFETEYLNAVEKTENPEALANSGPACKFCPAEAICPVKTGEAMRATRVNEITANKLAEYLPMVEELKSWIKSVEKMAHEQLELGAPIKGYKLVAKRATRVWNQPEIVEDKIRKAKKITLEDGFEYKLKSPAQIEKVCKTLGIDYLKQYAPLCSSVSSGTTIAKDSDKRSAVIPFAGLKQLNDMNK
tara:strand:+ start:37 stop:1203 length:1167 start_codon:yes stop_codon:yes gene_type:complete